MEILNSLIRKLRQKNKGFDEIREAKKYEEDGDHYTTFGGELEEKLGAYEIIKEDRNWKPDFDKINFEPQRRVVDSMFCTVFNTIKVIVGLQQAKFGFFEDYDEIPLANLAGVSPYTGGSPHAVAEAIRKHGMFPAGTYPFDDSITSKDQLIIDFTPDMLPIAARWLDKWEFGHEWVYPGIVGSMQSAMWEALKYSPLGVGVAAWHKDLEGFYYKPSWANDNHWACLVVGGKEDEYWLIYDSYLDGSGTPYKKVRWDYPFSWVKKYQLNKKDIAQQDLGKDLFERLKGKHIQRTEKEAGGHGEIYFVGDKVKYGGWWTNDEWLQKLITEALMKEYTKGTIVPVSEKDFEDLISYIKLAGIPLEVEGLAAINKLNK